LERDETVEPGRDDAREPARDVEREVGRLDVALGRASGEVPSDDRDFAPLLAVSAVTPLNPRLPPPLLTPILAFTSSNSSCNPLHFALNVLSASNRFSNSAIINSCSCSARFLHALCASCSAFNSSCRFQICLDRLSNEADRPNESADSPDKAPES